MKTIAAAANPRPMIYAALAADAPLLALLDNDPLRILPRIVDGVPLDPTRVPRPFLLVRFEGDGVAGVEDRAAGRLGVRGPRRAGAGPDHDRPAAAAYPGDFPRCAVGDPDRLSGPAAPLLAGGHVG